MSDQTTETPAAPPTFTNSRGLTIRIQPINPWLMEALPRAVEVKYGKPKPTPPTYAIETFTGAVEKHEHDETTLETDEDRVAYATYLVESKKYNDLQGDLTMRLMAREGVLLPEDLNAWQGRMAFLGIPIPENPDERHVFYVKTEVVGNMDDAKRLISEIMLLGGLSKEALQIAENSFRREMEKTGRPTPGGAGHPEGGLVAQTPADGNGSDGEMGNRPKRVRRAASKR